MSPTVWEFLITCEHAGNRIPAWLKKDFLGKEDLIQSHYGYDLGALRIAAAFARKLSTSPFFSTTSRLVCDLNRSLGNPTLFSAITRPLPPDAKNRILQKHYYPHRQKVEDHIQALRAKNRSILHLAVHSFTPVLAGKVRKTDIGLLFDPARKYEALFCHTWRSMLCRTGSDLAIHLNSPYKGTSDGFPTYLRTQYPPSKYIGIELEINNRLLKSISHRPPALSSFLIGTFLTTFREVL